MGELGNSDDDDDADLSKTLSDHAGLVTGMPDAPEDDEGLGESFDTDCDVALAEDAFKAAVVTIVLDDDDDKGDDETAEDVGSDDDLSSVSISAES